MSRHNIDKKYVHLEKFSDGGPVQTLRRVFNLEHIEVSDAPSPCLVKDGNPESDAATSRYLHKSKRQQISVVGWVTDASVTACMVCAAPFYLARRRHHCRCCGNITCRPCSPHRVLIGELGYATPQRTCVECYDESGPSKEDTMKISGNSIDVRRVLVGTKEDGQHSTIGWVIDSCVDKCMICAINLTEKRHCRACGHIFCKDCIPHRLQLPRRSHIGLQPVCLQCFCKKESSKTASFSDATGPAVTDTTRSLSPLVPQTDTNLRSSPLPISTAPNNSPPPIETNSQPAERTSAASPFSTASTIPMYTPPVNAPEAHIDTVSDSGTRRPSVENMDFGVDMERGWLKKKNGIFGWRSTYVVLDQGLLSLYDDERAEPPFGHKLREAVLLSSVRITSYGELDVEPKHGISKLFARRSSTFDSVDESDNHFVPQPAADGTKKRIHVFFKNTKSAIDFEADNAESCSEWYSALVAHAEIADEQTMGDFNSHSVLSTSFAVDDGGVADDQRSEYSAMSSFGSTVSGASHAESRRRSSVKRAAWVTYNQFLQESCNEDILMAGEVSKQNSKGSFQQRCLVLTNKPRLFYLDAAGVVVHNYDMKVLKPLPNGADTSTVARLRSADTFDVLTTDRRVLFRDTTGSAPAWVKLINSSFEETAISTDDCNQSGPNMGTNTDSGKDDLGRRQSLMAPVDDAARGLYYPTPVTSFKVKKKDGSKVFVNICCHSILDEKEEILQPHPAVQGEKTPMRVYDFIVHPSRTEKYVKLKKADGSDTKDSHAARRPIALEAIEEINLKFEHLDTDRFVFPATIGNYRGAWQSFHKEKHDD